MCRWLTCSRLADIRPNFIYDVTKWLFIGAISLIVAAGVFLYRYLLGYPRDLVLIALIFVVAFLIMIAAFIIGRYGRKRAAPYLASTPKPEVPVTDLECPSQWTHEIAKEQLGQIVHYVKLEQVFTYNERLHEPIPSIGFKFAIRNNSLFDISIDDEINGEIYYNGTALAEPKIVQFCGKNISHQELSGITIEQRLTKTEAQHIATSAGTFHFSALRITFKGGTDFPQVPSRRLTITEHDHALKHEQESVVSAPHKLKLEINTSLHPDKRYEPQQSGVFISADFRPVAPYGTETDKTKFILKGDIFAQYNNEDSAPVRVEWLSATLLAETRELNLNISTLEDGHRISNEVVVPASEKSSELCFEIAGEFDISWRALLNWRSCLRIKMKAIRQEVYCIDLVSEEWEHAWTTSQRATFNIKSAGRC